MDDNIIGYLDKWVFPSLMGLKVKNTGTGFTGAISRFLTSYNNVSGVIIEVAVNELKAFRSSELITLVEQEPLDSIILSRLLTHKVLDDLSL